METVFVGDSATSQVGDNWQLNGIKLIHLSLKITLRLTLTGHLLSCTAQEPWMPALEVRAISKYPSFNFKKSSLFVQIT